MKFWQVLITLAALTLGAGPAAATTEVSYARLVDRLDRPSDGYCLDVLGSGQSFRFDMPLMAHNCKPGRAPDGLVTLRADGSLWFPAFDACVTAMGVNRALLAGAALMLKPCDAQLPFLNAANFQRFEHRSDGRLAVQGFDLCLTVGATSDRTFARSHAWRTLFVADCADAAPELSVWEFVPR